LAQYVSHYDRLVKYISRCDRALSLGAVAWWCILIRANDLFRITYFFGVRIILKDLTLPPIGARGRKRGSSSVGCARELLLTVEPDLLLRTPKWRIIAFSFWGVLSEYILSDVAALPLKGFLGSLR